MKTIVEEFVIANTLGMHLRPAQQIVQTVLKFTCDVNFEKDGHRVNAKSIMGLLTREDEKGEGIRVI